MRADSPFSTSSIRTDNDSIRNIFSHRFSKVLKHRRFGVELLNKREVELKWY